MGDLNELVERLREELREARMQALASDGQAHEALGRALAAEAKVRANSEGDGEVSDMDKAEKYFLRLQAIYDQPYEDNPDWTNLGASLKRIRAALASIPTTGGEKA